MKGHFGRHKNRYGTHNPDRQEETGRVPRGRPMDFFSSPKVKKFPLCLRRPCIPVRERRINLQEYNLRLSPLWLPSRSRIRLKKRPRNRLTDGTLTSDHCWPRKTFSPRAICFRTTFTEQCLLSCQRNWLQHTHTHTHTHKESCCSRHIALASQQNFIAN
jgi:hypothetical protein